MFSSLKHEWRLLRHHEFDFLIFFVTGKCNSRCQHCFYWQNLGPQHDGLSIAEIEKLAVSMPPFRTLLLSGGEPSLRQDLPDLVERFYVHNRIKRASIPSNGLLPARIADIADRIAARLPEVEISFNLSLDGFRETHDRIRGVPGNYDRIQRTVDLLSPLKQAHPNLRLVINTVICADNWMEVVDLAREVRRWQSVDGHFFEIVRGLPRQERLKAVPPDALWQIYGQLLPLQETYIRIQARQRGARNLWRHVSRIGQLVYQYRDQWRVYSLAESWTYPCMAGEAIATVDYDGQLRICELRDTAVSLDGYEFDFQRARDSAVIRSERREAKQHICDCTHVCFMTTSMHHSLSTRLIRIPWAYLRYRFLGWRQ